MQGVSAVARSSRLLVMAASPELHNIVMASGKTPRIRGLIAQRRRNAGFLVNVGKNAGRLNLASEGVLLLKEYCAGFGL
jgi:hypothetical protein